MIANGLEFSAPELSDAQLEAGLVAALAVFEAAKVTPFQAAYAQDLIHAHGEFELFKPEDGEELEPGFGPEPITASHETAYPVWDQAYQAAIVATSRPGGDSGMGNLVFRAVPTDVDALVPA